MTIGAIGPGEASLARQLARAAVDLGHFDADVIAKASRNAREIFAELDQNK
jgi:hypothetical protein